MKTFLHICRAALVLLLLAFSALAVDPVLPVCSICKKPVTGNLYAVHDRSHGLDKKICDVCILLRPRCFVCNMPVVAGEFSKFKDGRLICAADLADAVFKAEDAQKVMEATQTELKRLFWDVLAFPSTNITFNLVDRSQLNLLAKVPAQSTGLEGLTMTRVQTNLMIYATHTNAQAIFEHRIYSLYGMPRTRLMAICSHEMTHVWLNEHLSRSRKLDRNTVEAFCELVAYRVMQSLNQPFEQEVIEANLYSRGQINVLLETDKRYPFAKIIDWMQYGTAARLTDENLHEILSAQAGSGKSPDKSMPFKITYSDQLQLKGITGGGEKLALINNKTLELGETGKVIVGNTNITVKVEKIEQESVTVRLPDGALEILKLSK